MAAKKKPLTDEQKAQRTRQVREIHARIANSGQIPDPDKATAIALAIEEFIWGDGDDEGRAQREGVAMPMVTQGHVRYADIVAKANKAMADLSPFD
jgi:hypothetical protein